MTRLRRSNAQDPLKKSNPLLEIVSAGVQFVLLVIGIIGVATTIFKPGGLLESLGGTLLRMEFATLLFLIPLVLITGLVGRYWYELHFSKSSSALIAELAMYTVMAVGAYYLLTFLFPDLW